jgi:hypothetical protein
MPNLKRGYDGKVKKKTSLRLSQKKPKSRDLSKTGLLGKLGKMDRKLIFYTDLEDDNDLMREFLLKDLKQLTDDDLLKPFPDFGFNNELNFIKTEGLTPKTYTPDELSGKKERSLEELNRRFVAKTGPENSLDFG